MKKLFVVLKILFVGILVCGWSSQAAAPATPVPTAVPTEGPTTAAPTATPTPIPDQKIYITKTLTFEPAVIKFPVVAQR